MAGPPLRVVRRPKGTPRALVAASAPVQDPAKAFRTAAMSANREDWQSEAWDMYDIVGELHYYVSWRSVSCSRCRLVASDLDPETGMPTGATENDRVSEIVRAIAGGALGQAGYVKRSTECLTVPGEYWGAVINKAPVTPDAPPESIWLVLNREEIKVSARATTVTLPGGEKYDLNLAQDTIFRVWNPRARNALHADSPVRATLDPLREIVRTTKAIANASKSRLIGNGVVFVPNEMSLPSAQAPVSADKPPGSIEPPPMMGTAAVDQLQEMLLQAAQVAVEDPDSMTAHIPIFAAVPGDEIKNVFHLKFENQLTEVAIKTRNDAIARLAMGLDVSPERLLGLGSSNHWSAWQITDEDVRLHISPVMEVICQALNEQVLKPLLEREGIDPSKYMVWYDASDLTADPDLTEEATAAFDRGAISAESYREFLGLGETGYDLLGGGIEEWQRWATDRIAQNPEWLPKLLPLLDPELQALDFPSAQPAIEAPPQDQADDDEADAEPDTEDDQPEDDNGAPPDETASLDGRNLDDVGAAFVDLLVGRALELAGKRRRTHADHERLRDVPMHDTHRYMPAVSSLEVDRLIKGWDAVLDDGPLARLGLDADLVRAAVRRRARAELTTQVVTVEV